MANFFEDHNHARDRNHGSHPIHAVRSYLHNFSPSSEASGLLAKTLLQELSGGAKCPGCDGKERVYKDRLGACSNLDGRGNYDIFQCAECSDGSFRGPSRSKHGLICAGTRPRGRLETGFNLVVQGQGPGVASIALVLPLDSSEARQILMNGHRNDNLIGCVLKTLQSDDGNQKLHYLCRGIARALSCPHDLDEIFTLLELDRDMVLLKKAIDMEKGVRVDGLDGPLFDEGVLELCKGVLDRMPDFQRRAVDKASARCERQLSSMSSSFSRITVADGWESMKMNYDLPMYRIMKELAKLKKYSASPAKYCLRFKQGGDPPSRFFKNEEFFFAFSLAELPCREDLAVILKIIDAMFTGKYTTVLECEQAVASQESTHLTHEFKCLVFQTNEVFEFVSGPIHSGGQTIHEGIVATESFCGGFTVTLTRDLDESVEILRGCL